VAQLGIKLLTRLDCCYVVTDYSVKKKKVQRSTARFSKVYMKKLLLI